MKSYKQIHLNIWKEYDYTPLSKEEKDRIQIIVMAELEDLASKFDGPVNLTIIFEGKGNC